jgi:hypothetical protein
VDGNDVPVWSNDPVLTYYGFNGESYVGQQFTNASDMFEIQDHHTIMELDIGVNPPTQFSPISQGAASLQSNAASLIELRISTERILAKLGVSLQDYFRLDTDAAVQLAGPYDTANKTDWTDVSRGLAFNPNGLNTAILNEKKTQFRDTPTTWKNVPGIEPTVFMSAIHLEDLRHPLVGIAWVERFSISLVPDATGDKTPIDVLSHAVNTTGGQTDEDERTIPGDKSQYTITARATTSGSNSITYADARYIVSPNFEPSIYTETPLRLKIDNGAIRTGDNINLFGGNIFQVPPLSTTYFEVTPGAAIRFNNIKFTDGNYPIAKVITDETAIMSLSDERLHKNNVILVDLKHVFPEYSYQTSSPVELISGSIQKAMTSPNLDPNQFRCGLADGQVFRTWNMPSQIFGCSVTGVTSVVNSGLIQNPGPGDYVTASPYFGWRGWGYADDIPPASCPVQGQPGNAYTVTPVMGGLELVITGADVVTPGVEFAPGGGGPNDPSYIQVPSYKVVYTATVSIVPRIIGSQFANALVIVEPVINLSSLSTPQFVFDNSLAIDIFADTFLATNYQFSDEDVTNYWSGMDWWVTAVVVDPEIEPENQIQRTCPTFSFLPSDTLNNGSATKNLFDLFTTEQHTVLDGKLVAFYVGFLAENSSSTNITGTCVDGHTAYNPLQAKIRFNTSKIVIRREIPE